MNFHTCTFQVHIRFWPNLNSSLEHRIEVVLTSYVGRTISIQRSPPGSKKILSKNCLKSGAGKVKRGFTSLCCSLLMMRLHTFTDKESEAYRTHPQHPPIHRSFFMQGTKCFFFTISWS